MIFLTKREADRTRAHNYTPVAVFSAVTDTADSVCRAASEAAEKVGHLLLAQGS
jgi:hypothetical protein